MVTDTATVMVICSFYKKEANTTQLWGKFKKQQQRNW